MKRLLLLLILFLPFHAQATDSANLYLWTGQFSWHPTFDYYRVSISMTFTDEYPIDCSGIESNACARLPQPKEDEVIRGRGCRVGIPDFTSPPTDNELIAIGRAFFPCIMKDDRHQNIVERVTTPIGVALTVVSNIEETVSGLTECELTMSPLGKRLSSVQARTLGHEVLHCFRGSWHDTDDEVTD